MSAPLADPKIRTAQLTVAVSKAARVTTQADAAAAIAERVGGEVDTDDRTAGRDATATLGMRVPPARLQSVLTALSRLGSERSRTSSVEDVAERVADVDSRVTSARAEIARLRTLYARATKVSDVLEVESDLSGHEADLESLEAQQRTLARQTAMASVTLTLVTAARAVPKPPHRTDKYAGFWGGLHRGWDAFLSAARAVGTAIGAAWPFLVIVLALAAGARVLTRRRRITSPPAPAAEA